MLSKRHVFSTSQTENYDQFFGIHKDISLGSLFHSGFAESIHEKDLDPSKNDLKSEKKISNRNKKIGSARPFSKNNDSLLDNQFDLTIACVSIFEPDYWLHCFDLRIGGRSISLNVRSGYRDGACLFIA